MAQTQQPDDREPEQAPGSGTPGADTPVNGSEGSPSDASDASDAASETPSTPGAGPTAETAALPAAAQTPGRGTAAPLGTVGDGRYRLTHRLGRGGMAEVFAAQDVRLARTVAVKLLRPELAQDDTARLRFTREAHSVAGLNHHSIVAVYDTGEEEQNGESTPFIVMELVEGRTVRELLVDEEAPPVDQALIITAGVLEALAYSHRHGIVHRDIKPANVIITTGGAVKVMDFGIARALTGAASTMTQTGMVMGTPQYLSPEQALGKAVDHRSDLYAAGCMLYELLTLRPPFVGETPLSVVYQHVQDAPVPPSQANPRVPASLDDLVLRSLAKNPDDRFQSADEFRAHLQHALREMHGAAGAGYAAGAAAAAAAAAGLAAAGSGHSGGQPPYEGTPSGGTAATEPLGSVGAGAGAPTDPTAVLPYPVSSPFNTPSAPYPAVDGPYRGGPAGPGGRGPDGEEPEYRRRGPWAWVVAAVVLVIAASVGIGLALNSNKSNNNQPANQTSSVSTPADTTPASPTPTPSRSTHSASPTETASSSPSLTSSPSASASPSSSASASPSPSTSSSPTETSSASSSSSPPASPSSNPLPSSTSSGIPHMTVTP